MSDQDSSRDRLLALCLFAFLFSIYLLTFSGRYHSSDEMSMLAVTDSLARRAAWDIEYLRWMGEQQGSFGPDGHLYSRKGIGTTLAALPAYWLALRSDLVGNVQAAMLTNGLLTAATAVLVFLLLRRLGYRAGIALGTALAFGLGTMAWPYARYLFSETLAGLGLLLSAYFLLPLPPAGTEAGITGRRVLLAGAGLGLALLARLNNALAAPFLGLLLLYYLQRSYPREWRRWLKPLALFGLPALAALAAIGWYNWLRFGSPWTTGYLPQERFATPFFQGFYGLTLSPGKGLLWYNPLLWAALIAWPAFFRRHRAEALLVGALVLSNVAFYAPWYLWWAGHSWGPRFLVTILPFAALPLAPALEAAGRRRTLAVALVALALLSAGVQVLGVAVDFNLYLEDIYARLGLYHPATLFAPAYSPLLRQMAYLRPENLDLAWARNGVLNGPALLTALSLVLIAATAVWIAGGPRARFLRRGGWLALLLLLFLGAARLLVHYAPAGDIAAAAADLGAMEQPAEEAAALAEPLLSESFQDAYDGRLWVWGVPEPGDVRAGQEATWTLGSGSPEAAAARFQLGAVRLEWGGPQGQPFDIGRLPVEPMPQPPQIGEAARLLAVRHGELVARHGDSFPLALYWQALEPDGVSYTVFVQAVDEAGRKAGQVDRLPCDGGCPTSGWRPGDIVGERYDLPIAADTPPGRYQLIAGMYDLTSGQTLSWSDGQGRDLGRHLLLGTLRVQP